MKLQRTPKLSVIITTYNFEKYVVQCVNSVLTQNIDFDIEILITDDCSTDNTFKLLHDNFGQHLHIEILQPDKNRGITKNLREMLNRASGKYIMTLDGDDYLTDTNYFKRAIEFLDNNPKYSTFCSGYQWLLEDGTRLPSVDTWFISKLEEVFFKDLLQVNHITLGRIFRNYKNLIPEWIHDDLHEDWALNAEVIKYGPAKCESAPVGIYRITNSGRITSLSSDQIREKDLRTVQAIKSNIKFKTISIVDCYVHNPTVREKLSTTLDWLREDNHDVLLISNTTVDIEMLKKTKFYLYDSRNQLFEEKYEIGGKVVDFWKIFDDNFEVHDILPELQKHGLSVLINLFNALHYAKLQGYTHFQRIEVDDLMGQKSRDYIKTVPGVCISENKHGLFYYNEHETPSNISFHYFYCHIEKFLQKITHIFNERDYLEYLKQIYKNKAFQIVEVFVYENLKRSGDAELITKTSVDMNVDFPDTLWNTESSVSSMDPKYLNCTTKLYYVNEYDVTSNTYIRGSSYILLSYSYHTGDTTRQIEVKYMSGEKIKMTQVVSGYGSWMYHELSPGVESIIVYENEKLLYTEHQRDCISFVNIKRTH